MDDYDQETISKQTTALLERDVLLIAKAIQNRYYTDNLILNQKFRVPDQTGYHASISFKTVVQIYSRNKCYGTFIRHFKNMCMLFWNL